MTQPFNNRFKEDYEMNPICPYCGKVSKLVRGDEVYCGRPGIENKWFYECLPCDAHVGCHPGTRTPLGNLANGILRRLRLKAHKVFDTIWKTPKKTRMNRTMAYTWLSRQTGIPYKQCHIGMMDEVQCTQVIIIATAYLKSLN